MKSAIAACALLLMPVAGFAEPAFARSYLKCLTKKGLRGIEWVILGQDTAESCAFPSYFALPLGFESTMNVGWHEQRSEGGGCGVHIRSPVFDRNRQCAAFSVIRKRV